MHLPSSDVAYQSQSVLLDITALYNQPPYAPARYLYFPRHTCGGALPYLCLVSFCNLFMTNDTVSDIELAVTTPRYSNLRCSVAYSFSESSHPQSMGVSHQYVAAAGGWPGGEGVG